MTTLLRDIYYDVSNPASFGSVDKLYRAAVMKDNRIKQADVENFLSGEIAYTLHRRVVRSHKRNPVLCNFHSDLAQADLIDVTRYSKDNSGHHFILTLIDVFSKFAFAVPIKRKTAIEVTRAMEKIFDSYRPCNLQTDEGKEFTNASVQKLLRERYINFYLAKNERIKCAVVERFQRTLLTKLHKYFTSKGTNKFTDILGHMMEAYNNTYHRSIRMTPIEATTADIRRVFRNLYGYDNMRDYLKGRKNTARRNTGEAVRIPEQKHRFRKGYAQNFTDEIYKIKSINQSYGRPVYKLEDYKEETVPGTFYPEEVQRITNEDKYRVTILDERKRGRGKQYLVRWANFPDLEPEWIAASQLEDIA